MKKENLQLPSDEVVPDDDGPDIGSVPTKHGDQKKFGVVYTPAPVVNMILDKIHSLKNVSICDPSCGNGQLLVAVAERVCGKIKRCRTEESRKSYRATLGKLTGIDIDQAALTLCRRRLDAVLQKYGLRPVKWKLQIADALQADEWKTLTGFDFVIGNPPYVRIQHLEQDRRQTIANGDWQCMQGCADLFILFFEMGLRLAKTGGRLIYIAPGSWMKSKSGRSLRGFIRNHHKICSITDFGNYQVFNEVTTYTAITEIAAWVPQNNAPKAWKCSGFKEDSPVLSDGCLRIEESGWQVLSASEFKFMRSIADAKIKLRDVANIHVGIQTLADDVFIFSKGSIDIESGITRRVMKASVMKNGKDICDRLVIYPYIQGKLMPEKDIMEKYPKAYKYLLRNKRRLLQRDKGKLDPRRWYGFGRDVSITSGFGIKLLTSSMNLRPNFQGCSDPNALFYSGYCIKPKEGVCISMLLDDLNSERMAKYIRLVSRPFRNGWYSYAKSFIQDYPIKNQVYENAHR